MMAVGWRAKREIMAETPPEYELFALKYATRAARRSEHFIGGDPHDGPMSMDYYIWVAVSDDRTVLIDTGFGEAVAARRGRTLHRDPVDALGLIGIDAATVQDIVITHLHYDHAGNLGCFPNANFHIQELEMHHVAGRQMKHRYIAQAFEVEDVVAMIRLNFAGRVVMHSGETQLCDGIVLHPGPGHTPGLQFVRVFTKRGWVVLASDASHYYENLEAGRPFTIANDLGAMIETFDLLQSLAPSPDHIVPGHDPLVMSSYPPASPALDGIAVRLDLPPVIGRGQA
jgi:glyoxylase-like metal-dependent hydrolase (beta-lactamase superfamily II)